MKKNNHSRQTKREPNNPLNPADIIKMKKQNPDDEIEKKLKIETAFDFGFKEGKAQQKKEELEFLKSDEIKWLVHEADLCACHEEYEPIVKRIKQLEKEK